MSSAGHILDMITRIRNNEAFRKMIRYRYKEMKEQYAKHTSTHLEFIWQTKIIEIRDENSRNKYIDIRANSNE